MKYYLIAAMFFLGVTVGHWDARHGAATGYKTGLSIRNFITPPVAVDPHPVAAFMPALEQACPWGTEDENWCEVL